MLNYNAEIRNDLRSLSFNYDVFSYVFLIFKCLKKHQSECPFKVVKCPNLGCTEKLTKHDLKIHVTFECSWRKVSCEYCQESFVVNQRQVCRLKHKKKHHESPIAQWLERSNPYSGRSWAQLPLGELGKSFSD